MVDHVLDVGGQHARIEHTLTQKIRVRVRQDSRCTAWCNMLNAFSEWYGVQQLNHQLPDTRRVIVFNTWSRPYGFVWKRRFRNNRCMLFEFENQDALVQFYLIWS
jgi:hypothetical protein